MGGNDRNERPEISLSDVRHSIHAIQQAPRVITNLSPVREVRRERSADSIERIVAPPSLSKSLRGSLISCMEHERRRLRQRNRVPEQVFSQGRDVDRQCAHFTVHMGSRLGQARSQGTWL
jgi:hypothetical protein